MTYIIGNFQVSRAEWWCKFYDVKASDKGVGSTLDPELTKSGRNLRATTCLAVAQIPVPALNQEKGK